MATTELTTYAPGDSPFRTKGNVYRALLESADLRVPGGRAAVLERLDEKALIAFYAQPFLAASTYDIFPIVPFGMIGAKIVGAPYPEFVRGGAQFSAKRDMGGIYRVLLKLASPEQVARRLPNIVLQYFNFRKIVGALSAPTTYEATCTGLPRPIVVWLLNVTHGFVPVVMERAGAKNVEIRIGHALVEGIDRGVEMMQTSFTVSWTK